MRVETERFIFGTMISVQIELLDSYIEYMCECMCVYVCILYMHNYIIYVYISSEYFGALSFLLYEVCILMVF